MLDINTLKALRDNDGLTLKNYQSITYKTGYQVATEGVKTTDINEAMQAIKNYGGNCGVWYSTGIYYIDKSKRISTKKQALKIGREHNQITILRWGDMGLIFC